MSDKPLCDSCSEAKKCHIFKSDVKVYGYCYMYKTELTIQWHRALDGDLPEENQEIVYWFKPCGKFLGHFKKSISEIHNGETINFGNCFFGKSGFLTDEDVYWHPVLEDPKIL